MGRFFAICLITCGAFLGGFFPGSEFGFMLAASGGGPHADAVWVVANILLSVLFAFCGKAIATEVLGQPNRWVDAVLAIVLGIVAGCVGYHWLNWELCHANPPL